MKYLLMGAAVLALIAMAGPASALSVEEVTRLKKAGVSDAVIQKMLEQEAAGVKNQGPMVETDSEVTFSAGDSVKADAQRKKQHEMWKQKKALDALQGVVIDQRSTSN
jgi:hypothetical protein